MYFSAIFFARVKNFEENLFYTTLKKPKLTIITKKRRKRMNKKMIPALPVAFVLTMAMSAVPVGAESRNELRQVVFINYINPAGQTTANVVDIDDPDGDGAQDGYELLGLWWDLKKYPKGVPYIVNPSTAVKNYGLTQSEVVAEIQASLENWDLAVDYEDCLLENLRAKPENLYNDSVIIDSKAKASTWQPDYKNVITWGRLRWGVVAMASIWYYTDTREIVDADIILNSRYKWGIDPDDEGPIQLQDAFDIQNVVTHEAGHWSGLKDLYNNTYWAMTMYGYTTYGETIKSSLEPGDVAGVQTVYPRA